MKRQFQLGYIKSDTIDDFKEIKKRLNLSSFGKVTNETALEYLIKCANEYLDGIDDEEDLIL